MPQYAYPDGDDSDGPWVNQAGNNTNLYASIDDTQSSHDDNTTYIQVTDGASTPICSVTLGDTVTSPEAGENAYIKYRAVSTNNGMGTLGLKVELLQDTTPKFTSTTGSVGTSYTDYSLTIGDHSSITDWTALKLRFTLLNDGSGMMDVLKVTQAYVEAPAEASSSVPIAAIAMNTYRQMRN